MAYLSINLDIINNNQIPCHSLGFCNVTGTFIYFKTKKLAIATTLVVNVRVPFNFKTWNKVVYTSGYVITYIIKTAEPNHLILILNFANKSYFIIKVNFCHLLAWFKNYDPLKVGVNSFWDTLYSSYLYLYEECCCLHITECLFDCNVNIASFDHDRSGHCVYKIILARGCMEVLVSEQVPNVEYSIYFASRIW